MKPINTCPVVMIFAIEPIPNSDLVVLTTNRLSTFGDGVRFVTGDHYEVGQLGFVIPEGAILPEKLLREMWLWNGQTSKGRLYGKYGNRFKPRVIGGLKSEYLFYGATYIHDGAKHVSPSWNPEWKMFHDVSEELGIEFK